MSVKNIIECTCNRCHKVEQFETFAASQQKGWGMVWTDDENGSGNKDLCPECYEKFKVLKNTFLEPDEYDITITHKTMLGVPPSLQINWRTTLDDRVGNYKCL